MYEGKPVGTPDAGAFWRVCSEYKVRGFFVAPTGLRAVRREDPHGKLSKAYDLSKMRRIFVAGERCDPETSSFYSEHIGVPVFDNWWQTETGYPICGFQDQAIGRKDGSASLPMPGYDVQIRLEDGSPATEPGQVGDIVIKLPLPPGTFPTLWNNDEGYKEQYMDKYPGFYLTGDAGFIDADGYVTILERTDDVMNVAAHRLSAGTLEAVIKAHPDVNDCAVIGVADPLKGEVPIVLFVLNADVTRVRTRSLRSSTRTSAPRSAPSLPWLPPVLWSICQRHAVARFSARTSEASPTGSTWTCQVLSSDSSPSMS